MLVYLQVLKKLFMIKIYQALSKKINNKTLGTLGVCGRIYA
jgi:hypothetical protein